MATHKSAEKRARQSEARRLRNRHMKTRVRSVVKEFVVALEGGKAEGVQDKLRAAERALRKAASKGLIPKRRASRTVSRLAKRLHKSTK
ncbi:MAG TPA: 30S ribosomal protein S20 [Myxococcota bacterium]|nr:30S ribosomal protein S20 [Myxococcota bacterium]